MFKIPFSVNGDRVHSGKLLRARMIFRISQGHRRAAKTLYVGPSRQMTQTEELLVLM